jgi:hypothetical protein
MSRIALAFVAALLLLLPASAGALFHVSHISGAGVALSLHQR